MNEESMIYLDNAATSHPKPDSVLQAVNQALTEFNANPGRSGSAGKFFGRGGSHAHYPLF